jgi:histidinol-phosphatase (PHP family)
MHSTFSDGRSSPEEYIKPAIDAGLNEIGFSEHLTLFRDPEEWNMDPAKLTPYLNHIEKLGKESSDIRIKTGLEVDFFPGREKEIRDIVENLPLDYLIGSVHFMGEKTVDSGPEFYAGKNFDSLFESYFEIVCAAVESEIFDIIGHCDLIRIFGYKTEGNMEHLYQKLAKTMKKHNVVFEVNTNGRNRPLADFYPDRKYLSVFRKENVPVCVNSDAHMPSRIGQYFDEAYDLLRYTGYNEMAVFEKRVRRMVSF